MNWLLGIAHKVLQITHGRTTSFFLAFFVAGNLMNWFGKLSPTYVAFMGTLGGLVLAHSIKEDVVAAVSPAAPPPTPERPPDVIAQS